VIAYRAVQQPLSHPDGLDVVPRIDLGSRSHFEACAQRFSMDSTPSASAMRAWDGSASLPTSSPLGPPAGSAASVIEFSIGVLMESHLTSVPTASSSTPLIGWRT